MQKTIKVAGRSLTFSPLHLGQIRELEQTLKDVKDSKVVGIDSMLAFVPHLHASLAPKHPDITQKQLEEMLTIEDLAPAQSAMLEASGLKAAEPGEPKPVQESTGSTSSVQ
jgi:hypothetical protein